MATVIVNRLTGTTPDKTNITDINTVIEASDAHTTGGGGNPVLAPESGANNSFWASFRLEVTANASGNTINNMKWYTDGTNSFGTGIEMQVALASAYAQASGTVGTAGSALSANTHLITSPTGAFVYTAASPLDINNTVTGTTATGEIGDYVVNQFQISSVAGAGSSETETWSYQYDQA